MARTTQGIGEPSERWPQRRTGRWTGTILAWGHRRARVVKGQKQLASAVG